MYPREEDDARRRWAAARAHLAPSVRVPELIADDGAGNHLVEDLGGEDLAARFAASPRERAEGMARAADAAAAIAALEDPGLNAPFDAALLRRELDLARQAVFELFLREPLSPADRAAHDAWAAALVAEITAHPYALCHRDYHANNLMPSGDTVAVIDFQDLRMGPDAYDLASLLWERTTLGWMTPEAAEPVVARFARRRGLDAGALSARLDRVLLQRAWKVCGTFARAIAERGADLYRAYLPGELALTRRLLSDSEDDRAFAAVLEARCRAVC